MACEICPNPDSYDAKVALCKKALGIYRQRERTAGLSKVAGAEATRDTMAAIRTTLEVVEEQADGTECAARSIVKFGLCPGEMKLNYALDLARRTDPSFDGILDPPSGTIEPYEA